MKQSQMKPLIEQLRTIVELLDTPALARGYVYILHHGPATVATLVDNTDIPQGTAYEYVRRLERGGLLVKTLETRPSEYDAESVSLTLSSGEQTQTINSKLIEAVSHRSTDRDIDLFIERHGFDGLSIVLESAQDAVEGTNMNQIADQELELSALEAEVALQALKPIVCETDNID